MFCLVLQLNPSRHLSKKQCHVNLSLSSKTKTVRNKNNKIDNIVLSATATLQIKSQIPEHPVN